MQEICNAVSPARSIFVPFSGRTVSRRRSAGLADTEDVVATLRSVLPADGAELRALDRLSTALQAAPDLLAISALEAARLGKGLLAERLRSAAGRG